MAVVCALAAPARAATEEDERAKAHFLAGQSYYEQASYTDALREFNEAYRISKRPALLYNIARCDEALEQLRRRGQDARALPARGSRDQRSRRRRDAHRATSRSDRPRAPSSRRPSPSRAVTAPPPSPPAPPQRKRLYTWIVGGVGVAALAAALGTGIASQLSYNDLSSKCSGTTCDPTLVANAQGKIDSGKRARARHRHLVAHRRRRRRHRRRPLLRRRAPPEGAREPPAARRTVARRAAIAHDF